MLGVSKDQDIIQINNNIQTHAMGKEQDSFTDCGENLRGHNQPRRQNLSTNKAGVAKQTVKSNGDA